MAEASAVPGGGPRNCLCDTPGTAATEAADEAEGASYSSRHGLDLKQYAGCYLNKIVS